MTVDFGARTNDLGHMALPVKPWIIERLDRKLMSRGLISNRPLVGSCFKMVLNGSIIVEICDETMAKMWRKPVEMEGLFACMLFFFLFRLGTVSLK